MSTSCVIRPFQAIDESAVRRICYETAFFGQSMEPFGVDVRLLTDVLLLPYLKFCPHLFLVAVKDARVAGYLAGCVDTRSLRRHTSGILLGPVVRNLFLKTMIFKSSNRAIIRYGIRASRAGQALNECAAPWPAHFHINIHPECRRAGIGGLLLNEFMNMLKRDGISGVHLTTSSDVSRPFFEKHGFREVHLERTPSLFSVAPHEWRLLARNLPDGDGP